MRNRVHQNILFTIGFSYLMLCGCGNADTEDFSHMKMQNESYQCFYKSLGEKLPNGQEASNIYISKSLSEEDSSYMVISFGNKLRTPNIYFDLKDIFIYSKNDSSEIYSDKEDNHIFGHLTDNILPLRFYVESNADGDLSGSGQIYFTGGFHGYKNSSESNAAPTLFEQKKSVFVDGQPLSIGQKATGNHIRIVTENLLQASNTEKRDGKGRYALKQVIIVDYEKDTAFVNVEYTPLENILVYQVDGLGFFNDLEQIRFVGSKSKTGVYPNNIVNRADRYVNAIRQFDDKYCFDVFIDSCYGIGNLVYNFEDYNAQTTEVQKSYFHLLGSNDDRAVSFKKGQAFLFRGGYTFFNCNN